MQCLKPVDILNPITYKHIAVPCGKCNFCLINKKNEWALRMYWEQKRSSSAAFVTLTYDDEHVPLIYGETWDVFPWMTLNKKHVLSFLKVLKQKQRRYLRKHRHPQTNIRYYLVGEYGSKYKRPHYHAIIFNLHPHILNQVETIWGKGQVHIGDSQSGSINYTAKYQIDKDGIAGHSDPRQKVFSLMSKHIGENYIEKRKAWHQAGLIYYAMHEGKKRRLPRYYKERLFTQEQREIAGKLAQIEAEQNYKATIKEYTEKIKDKFKAIQLHRENIKAQHARIKTKSIKQNTL